MNNGDAQPIKSPDRDELDAWSSSSSDGEAIYHAPSFQPILGEWGMRRFQLAFQRPFARACTGLVLVDGRGDCHVFLPTRRPTMWELLRRGSGTLYEVDMGLHWTRLEFDLPSSEEAFPFHAVIDVEWRVTKPEYVVRDGVNDVGEALSLSLYHRLSEITREFDVEKASNAEKKALEVLASPAVGQEYGLQSRVFLRLMMDAPSATHAAAIRDVQRQVKLERETQQLRLLREEVTTKLITERVARYRDIMLAGDFNQFALQLAQDPGDVATVVQMLRDERGDKRRNFTDFVTRLLESGAIDRYEINDQVRVALGWLKDATDTVLRGPEAPVRVPGQRDSDSLPHPDIRQPDLPEPPRVDTVRAPGDAPTPRAGAS